MYGVALARNFFSSPLLNKRKPVLILEELHFANGIRAQVEVPIDCEIEHTLEKGQLAVYGRARHFSPSVQFIAFDVSGDDFADLTFAAKEVCELLKHLLISQP
jgi:hypothetical protein